MPIKNLICITVLIISNASAAELVKLRVNVVAEKKAATINFNTGATATFGDGTNLINGISGKSDAFGAQLPLAMIFTKPMEDAESMPLSEYQFRLHGSAKCDLVQKGTSPDMPYVGVTVLAQNCTLLSIAH